MTRHLILPAFIALLLLPDAVSAQSRALCAPRAGFVDAPPPRPLEFSRLVSRTETIVIDRPLEAVLASGESAALEDVVAESDLPHVVGTHNLTPGRFHAPGSRRIACLSDGSTLVEQALVRTRTAMRDEFRYIVWGYTTPQARAVDYSVGRFISTALPGGRTRVTWTYGFRLKRDEWPGRLGSLGNWAFRVAFLDRTYAAMMRGTLRRMKARAEARPL